MPNLTHTPVIEPAWFNRSVLTVAPELIGCHLVRRCANGDWYRGMIVEVEAYGPDDPACHAYRKRTPRNAVMFGPAGYSYVYLIYGMYHCFNIVTDQDGVASAVLVRALELELGLNLDPMLPAKTHARLAAGPGKLCRAFQIDRSLSAVPLMNTQPLWLEHPTITFQREDLVQTTRIGLTQGADLPWRWYLKASGAVSKR
jgi:DNA-3-methyladenine glycosylase